MSIGICTYDLSVERLLELGRAADELGVETLWLGEHLVVPPVVDSRHPAKDDGVPVHNGKPIVGAGTWLLDPLVALSAVAGATTHLTVATGVCILPLQHPLWAARAAATLSLASGGRFLFGVGGGWLRDEFDAVGVPYEERGSRLDESLAILEQAWAGGPVHHHGAHFDVAGLQVVPERVDVPVVVGGNSPRALRRAVRHGHGWLSSGSPTLDEIRPVVHKLRRLATEADRPELRTWVRMTGITEAQVAAYAAEGIDDVVVWAHEVFRGATPDERRATLIDALHLLRSDDRSTQVGRKGNP